MRIVDIIKKEIVGKISEVYLTDDGFREVKIIDCWYNDVSYEPGWLTLHVEDMKTLKKSTVMINSINDELKYW